MGRDGSRPPTTPESTAWGWTSRRMTRPAIGLSTARCGCSRRSWRGVAARRARAARQLDLDKSVIHRILATLVAGASSSRTPPRGATRWVCGCGNSAALLFGRPAEALAETELREGGRIDPYATGYFAQLDGADVVAATIRGPGPVNVYIDPGTRLAAELTVTGRALLACLPRLRWCRPFKNVGRLGSAAGPTMRSTELEEELG